MKISIVVLLLILFTTLSACKLNADEQINVITVNNEIDDQDKKRLNELRKDLSIIMGEGFEIKKELVRNTGLRTTISFDVPKDKINLTQLNKIDFNVKNILKGKLLDDNGRGARIYCLSDQKTFEIHEPLSISKNSYDMNDDIENKGVYKLVQLNDSWNVRIYLYKDGNDFCNL